MRHERGASRRHGAPKIARTTTSRSSSTRRALQRDPDNVNARTGLQRARLRASQDHFTRARRLVAHRAGSTKRSPSIKLAAELNPDNREIAEELEADAEPAARESRRSIATARPSSRRLSSACAISRCPASTCPPSRCPTSSTSATPATRSIIRALAQMSKVNVVFDPAFRPHADHHRASQHDVRSGAAVDHRQHADLLSRDGASARSRSSPTRPPSGASTRKTSSAPSI